MKRISAGALGWLGVIILVSGYALMSFDVIEADSLTYPAINLAGAVCIMLYAFKRKSKQTFLLNVFWAGVATISIIKMTLMIS